ncbi:MAG: hypothetical protein HYT79_06290 [Elusimicrobia bacterium]|nr:hypothetical protein [Elusimicrobiota bacterium]
MRLMGWMAVVAVASTPILAEQVNVVTQYPSPLGVYKLLRTAGDTFLAMSNGNVGIGANPARSKLHVFQNVNGTVPVYVGNSNTGASASTGFFLSDIAPASGVGVWAGIWGFNATKEFRIVNFDPSGPMTFNTGSAPSERMRITSGGNVGIGTASPSRRLHVQGDAYVSGKLGIGTASAINKLDVYEPSANSEASVRHGGTGANAILSFYEGSTQQAALIARGSGIAGGPPNALNIYTYVAGAPITLGTDSGEKVRIMDSGSIRVVSQDNSSAGFNMKAGGSTCLGGSGTMCWFSILGGASGAAPSYSNYALKIIASSVGNTISIDSQDGTQTYSILQLYSDYPNPNDRKFHFRNDGNAYADSSWNGGGADLAELMPVAEQNLEEGDVVALSSEMIDVSYEEEPARRFDPAKMAGLRKASSAYAQTVGVISSQPGLMTSSGLRKAKPVALQGRVPVKVTSENGPIAVGDRLAASSRSGYAMKAVKPGHVIGIALEPFDGQSAREGKIMVFLQPTAWSGDLADDMARLRRDNESLKLRLDKLEKRTANATPQD